MEEGSPGVFLKDYRVPKRSRATDVGGMDSEMMFVPNMVVPPSADMVLPKWASGYESFRDNLMNKVNLVRNVGIDVNSLEAKYEGLNDDEDVTISRGDRGQCIQFSDRTMDRLCKPWQNALIIKLLGRSHTYNYLHARLQQKWSPNGGWKLVDLVNYYFVVRFELEEDLNFRPGFCPATEKITRMAAWIRVSAIQLECFDVWALKRIGNLLGKLLKIDALTTSQNRGKFARLCVELDLSRPLEAFVQINNVWYNVEYEGLLDICYMCGCYGHKREHCDVPDAASVDKIGDGSNLGDDGLVGGDIVMGKKGVTQEVGGKGGRNTGSRFDVLRHVGENFGIDGRAERGEATQTCTEQLGSSVRDAGKGSKVWTKSKDNLGKARTVLNDISNLNVKEKGKVQATVDKVKEASYSKVGQLVNKSNLVYEGKKASGKISLTNQLNIWTNGQDAYWATRVYHFGHQPPNIATNCVDTKEEVDIDVDVDSLAVSTQEGLIPAEKMDLAASHVDPPNGVSADSTFTIGFPCFEIVDPMGFSGGLWLLWDDSKVNVEIIGTHDQAISTCVSWPGQSPWLFLAIYAKPCEIKRAKLWEYLNFVVSCHDMPWLLAGDFNYFLHFDDKLSGVPRCCLRGFKAWFDENEMCELHFTGPKYTCTNKRILERLDRVVCNTLWRRVFAEAYNWLGFSGSAFDKSCAFVEPLKMWNKNVFGHFRQKKARVVARRRRNRIERLKDDEGVWVEDAARIKDLAVGFFSKLFAPVQAAINVSLPCFFPSVIDGEIASLVKIIDLLEVKDSLFGIGGLKALGVDGFPACFYQH
ncbi:unnamed protein product [Prunus armeniaca]